MLRLLSIILLLCGLVAAGYAGSVLMDEYAPRAPLVDAAPAEEMATEEAFEAAMPPALARTFRAMCSRKRLALPRNSTHRWPRARPMSRHRPMNPLSKR